MAVFGRPEIAGHRLEGRSERVDTGVEGMLGVVGHRLEGRHISKTQTGGGRQVGKGSEQ